MNTTPIKILIADDSETDRRILQALVKREGHDVYCAEDGLQAVELFQKIQPDMVLLDLMMPNLDGYGAASRIKALSQHKLVPIVFLTAMTDIEALIRCLEVGGDDFLTKPYQRDILRAKMGALLRIQSLYKTLELQRDKIKQHQKRLEHEQHQAKEIFDKIAHPGCLEAPYIRYHLSPTFIFNGDILVAAEKPGGGLQFILGDVTGHGLPAAICAMPVAEMFYDLSGRGFALSDIITQINHRLCGLLPVGVFCCALAVEVDVRERVIRYWNGGMPTGYLVRAEGIVARMPSTHLALGIVSDDRFRPSVDTIAFEQNDSIFCYTDGVLENTNASGESFGEHRIESLIHSYADKSKMLDAVRDSMKRFQQSNVAIDDCSALQVTINRDLLEGSELSQQRLASAHGPKHFSFHLTLQAQALRESDPLPLLLYVLMEVPGIQVHRGQVFTILAELYSNALEHGLLRLDSQLKRSPQGFGEYYRLRHERLMALREGEISFQFNHQPTDNGGILEVQVSDSGEGFDYQKLQSTLLKENRGYAGRGVGLLGQLCTSIRYQGNGNVVCAIFEWARAGEAV